MRAAGSLHDEACKRIHDEQVKDLRISVLLLAVNSRLDLWQEELVNFEKRVNEAKTADLSVILVDLASMCCDLSKEELEMQRKRERVARNLYDEAMIPLHHSKG